jgi:hypothetical protein
MRAHAPSRSWTPASAGLEDSGILPAGLNGILRSSPWDALLVVAVVGHAAALLFYPSIPLIAIGLWWTANTSAHNFIHRPFFRLRAVNAAFSVLLTAVMGVPQTLWRDRHLAHHAGRAWRVRVTPPLALDAGLLGVMWTALALADAAFLFTVYMPGWLAGVGLCALQGHYEHAGGTTSHYGRAYNVLCFNDGYHAEHHAGAGLHWTELARRPAPGARSSRWPPLLRWLDAVSLDGLERLVLRSSLLQRCVLRCHRRAFERLLPHLPPIRRIAIVGGGLFPRTALILRDLLPAADILIVDADRRNLETARAWIGPEVTLESRRYPSSAEAAGSSPAYDLLVIPLAFDGDRDAIYRHRPAAAVVVHDWIWRRRGTSRVVSVALLKRLNLLTAACP